MNPRHFLICGGPHVSSEQLIHTKTCDFPKIEWLGRPRVRLTSSGLAPDHHTPRLVPYGAQGADWSTNGSCTQPTLRHNCYTHIPGACVRRRGCIDIAPTKRRSGRLLGITHVGTYRVVLTHPHDIRVNVAVNIFASLPLHAHLWCMCSCRHQVAARWIVTRARGERAYLTACPHHP